MSSFVLRELVLLRRPRLTATLLRLERSETAGRGEMLRSAALGDGVRRGLALRADCSPRSGSTAGNQKQVRRKLPVAVVERD
jgi:hypothetical protein